MKNKVISFSDQQISRIKKDAEEHEIPFTEMVKRILDHYYEEKEKSQKDKRWIKS